MPEIETPQSPSRVNYAKWTPNMRRVIIEQMRSFGSMHFTNLYLQLKN